MFLREVYSAVFSKNGALLTSFFEWVKFRLYPPSSLIFPISDFAGDGELIRSCSRSWPTTRCPSELEAISFVLTWAYRRWNKCNPADKLDVPSVKKPSMNTSVSSRSEVSPFSPLASESE